MTARQPPREKGAKACMIGMPCPATGFFAPIFREEQRMEDAEMTGETIYEITTQWGNVQLDERSYRDYLAGRSWLSSTFDVMSDSRGQAPATAECPRDVSKEAVKLRDEAGKHGIQYTLQANFPGKAVQIPYRQRMAGIGIEELNLSVRACNGLMRAGVNTLGKLNDAMKTERGIAGIRNLGAKSVKEINKAFLLFTYSQLSPAERAEYWQRMIDNDSRR